MLLSELETFRERTSLLLFLWLFRLFLVSLWDLIAEYCGLEVYELMLINFKNLADISRLPGVYFKMNREAKISLRAFLIQPKA